MHPTPAEAILWEAVRRRDGHYPLGAKFRRQSPILGYIADFLVCRHRLIIEVDGPWHEGRDADDRRRDQAFRRQGFRTLRVTNNDVIQRLPETLQRIEAAIG